MEYHVAFEINGKREILVLEHVLEEYGVSVQEFWCCWLASDKAMNGDGNTFEEAIQNLIDDSTMRINYRKALNEAIDKTGVQFKGVVTPFINAAMSTYRMQKKLVKSL